MNPHNRATKGVRFEPSLKINIRLSQPVKKVRIRHFGQTVYNELPGHLFFYGLDPDTPGCGGSMGQSLFREIGFLFELSHNAVVENNQPGYVARIHCTEKFPVAQLFVGRSGKNSS